MAVLPPSEEWREGFNALLKDLKIKDTPKAVKHIDGKPRFELIPPEFMLAFADLYTHGEDKYPDRNWEKGVGDKEYYDKLFGALQRHAWKWLGGEKIDASPPHKHHMLAVAWAAAAIYTLEMREKNGK